MAWSIADYNDALTQEQRTENARKAGKASAVAKRQHRLFREIVKEVLASPIDENGDEAEALTRLGLDVNHENAMVLAAARKAILGDIEALRFLRDTAGEKPTESYNMNLSGKPVKSLDLSSLSDEELEALADEADG